MNRIYKRMTLEEHFWKSVFPEPMSGCWIWDGPTDAHGYGDIQDYAGKHHRAHRVGYELLVGSIPAGLVLDHKCRNPSCVNPEHLRPMTNAENTAIGEGPSARNARKTHCKYGHEYTPANIYLHSGRRHCRQCKRAKMTEWNKMLKLKRAHREAA